MDGWVGGCGCRCSWSRRRWVLRDRNDGLRPDPNNVHLDSSGTYTLVLLPQSSLDRVPSRPVPSSVRSLDRRGRVTVSDTKILTPRGHTGYFNTSVYLIKIEMTGKERKESYSKIVYFTRSSLDPPLKVCHRRPPNGKRIPPTRSRIRQVRLQE